MGTSGNVSGVVLRAGETMKIDNSWGIDIRPIYYDQPDNLSMDRIDVLQYLRLALLRGQRECVVFHAVKQPVSSESYIYGDMFYYKAIPGESLNPLQQLIQDAEVGRKIRMGEVNG